MRTRRCIERIVVPLPCLLWLLCGCAPPPDPDGERSAPGPGETIPLQRGPSSPPGEEQAFATDDPRCQAGEPLPEAQVPGGLRDARSAIIPGGRAVTPLGTLVQLGRAPLGLALSPDGRHAYVTCDGDEAHALQVIDLEAGAIVQNIEGFQAFRGVAASADGARVVVAAGRSGQLLTFTRDEAGLLVAGPSLQLSGYLGDLALSPDGATAYVASNTGSQIFVVDLATLAVGATHPTGNYPYDLLVERTGRRLFVSNLAESTVGVVDLVSGELLATLPTCKSPEGMVLDEAGARLLVPCADDDTVMAIDSETLTVTDEFDLSHHPEGLLAASPTELALSPDGDVLYVVQSDLNQVDLVVPGSGELQGSLPAGWYPV
ncbi:MAG: hypothetical protein FJ125_12325, partial [Deltaproteobacteria bacterium]|nr:hypothetical protein [Deltaproteobacteria bacterium]